MRLRDLSRSLISSVTVRATTLLGVAIAGALSAGLCATASADVQGRSNTSLQIRAGVLIVDSNFKSGSANTTPLNDAPYIWFNLNNNTLVKPAGWTFYNPLGPTAVTPAVYTRWSSLIGAANVPTIGTQLTKQNAAYWEVPLSTIGDNQITNYDVLVLPASEAISLNPSERGRLQKFMDQGGVLWVDVSSSTTVDAANGLPIAFLTNNAAGGHQASILNSSSQLMSSPYTISYLPEFTFNNTLTPVTLSGTYAAFGGILNDVTPLFNRFEVIGKDGLAGNPTVLYAKVGDGALVVTGRGSSVFLNQATINGSPQTNTGFTALTTVPDSNANMVGRFVINAINLVGGFSQANGGSRGSSSNPVNIGAPLLQSWKDETQAGGTPGAPPITYKGLVFVTLGNRLYAYSAKPGADLYNTGNPDDGIQDYSQGKGRDLVWQSTVLNGPLSAPVAFPVPSAGGNNTDQVMVVDGSGNVEAFPVFPSLSSDFTNISPIKTYSPPGGAPVGSSNAPMPPVEHDGLVYITDNVESSLQNVGRVWVIDPLDTGNTKQWSVGGPNTQVTSQTYSAPVTVGYIPIFDNSGGVDKVVYAPMAPQSSNTCGIISLWAGVKGERHDVTQGSIVPSQYIDVMTRAGQASCAIYLPGGNSAQGLHVSLITANGDALSAAQMATFLDGTISVPQGSLSANQGEVYIHLKNGVGYTELAAAGVTAVVLDYSLDWSNSGTYTRNVLRGSVNLPDQTGTAATQQIIGNLALSPAGTLYACEGNIGSPSNGSFFAMREQGRGLFTFVNRFDLYPQMTVELSSSPSTILPPVFEDNDGLTQIPGAAPFLGGPLTGLYFSSGPTVRGSNVYVKARGIKTGSSGFPVPTTVVMAFAAEPSLPQFTTPVLQNGYTILQPDPSRSLDKTKPDAFTQLNTSQISYVVANGRGSISFSNLASGNRGAVNQIFSESLPIIIRQPGTADIVMYPDTTGTWSQLQWYAVFGGIDDNSAATSAGGLITTGNPVVAGSNLYFGGNSYLPLILTGHSPVGSSPTGVMVGMSTNISSSDTFLIPNSSRSWFKQLIQVEVPTPGTIAANPDILWPQMNGVTSPSTYVQRLLQTALGGSNTTLPRTFYGLVAGDGGLFAYSNLGIYGYVHADFTIADQNRIGDFDPDGNALWTANATLASGPGAPSTAGASVSANVRHLVRPTRAYKSGENYLVTDPGANRVALVDKSGREVRTIENFQVDPLYVPSGYTAGESLTLSGPQDAFTYTDIQTSSPYSNPAPSELWRHYVIADTGNHRLVELVDRFVYDTNSGQATTPIALGVLFYHSPVAFTGKGFDYNSVGRVLVTTPTPHYVYVTAMRSVTPTLTDIGLATPVPDPTPGNGAPALRTSGNGDGGIVVIDGANTRVINTITIPAMPVGTIYDPTTGSFNTQPIPLHQARVGNISSVTMSNYSPDGSTAPPVLRIMFTDASGIYEIVPDSTGTIWTVDWMLPTSVYTTMRWSFDGSGNVLQKAGPVGFQPSYARRTSAGTVIVANSYVGFNYDTTPFGGEVLEIEGDISSGAGNPGFSFNSPLLGFSALSIRFQLPGIIGARSLLAPVFADRQ